MKDKEWFSKFCHDTVKRVYEESLKENENLNSKIQAVEQATI